MSRSNSVIASLCASYIFAVAGFAVAGFAVAGFALAAEPLPRVLVLSDSVHRNMVQSAARELKGRVEFVFPKTPVGDTSTALARLDELVGDGKWDVIYFNFGLADLHYRDPRTKAVRAMSKRAGGIRVTSKQYEKNLTELVKRLDATGAKLIWASTTPITTSKSDNLFDPGSEVEYNAIAAKIMAAHSVTINDMHGFVMANIEKKKDPSPFGFKGLLLHPPVVDSVVTTLNLGNKVLQTKD